MMHFVANIQYYMMFEVLECSWDTFNKEMQARPPITRHARTQYLPTCACTDDCLRGRQMLNPDFASTHAHTHTRTHTLMHSRMHTVGA